MPQCRDQGDGEGLPGSPCHLDAVVSGGHVLLGASIRRLRTETAMGRERRRDRRPQGQLEQGPGIGRGCVSCWRRRTGRSRPLTRKGYDPLEVPETVVRAAEEYGCAIRRPRFSRPTNWTAGNPSILRPMPSPPWIGFGTRSSLAGMDDGKAKPRIRCFRKVMNGGTVVRGFLRDGIVYINEDLANGSQRRTAADGLGGDCPLPDRLEGRDPRPARLGLQVGGAGWRWQRKRWWDDVAAFNWIIYPVAGIPAQSELLSRPLIFCGRFLFFSGSVPSNPRS